MLDQDRARQLIRESPFAPLEAELAALLEPSIRIGVRRARPGSLELGESRFGGLPDLPASLSWPRCGERPMALIAQLRLSDLAPLDPLDRLPPRGWLYFFFDAANDAPFEDTPAGLRSWRVLYFDGEPSELKQTDPPEPRDKHNEFPLSALGFRAELTLPSYGSTKLADVAIDPEQRNEYEELVFALHARAPLPRKQQASMLNRLQGRLQHWWIGDPIHRVLGHPEHFQLDPRIDWQRLAQHRLVTSVPDQDIEVAARDWLLLLQVDNYQGGPDWMWGDNDTLYFGIHQDDLAERNFDAVQWTVECG